METQSEEVEEFKVKAEVKEEEEGPPPGYQTILSLRKPEESPSPSPSPPPNFTSSTSQISQVVCGSCRRLLKYPVGATQVQCSCCNILNFVLQAHEVGQVKCGSCTVLLMYPYGAPQVRCCSCQFVTEIGAHNQRPPWSAQQGPPLPCPNPSQ